MLDPEYLLRVSEGAEAIAETLHQNIIARIVKRIALRLDRGDNYTLTAVDKWQIETLQEAGLLSEEIAEELARLTGLELDEIRAAMEDAGVRTIAYDNAVYEAAGLSPAPLMESPYLIRLMQRNYEKTVGEWKNFTGTFAEAAQQTFIRECDLAYNLVSTGAVSYTQAFTEAIDRIVSEGVYVEYPGGHRDTIETATLRCVRTGISQACSEVTNARLEEMGWDIIIVSAHLGARINEKEDYTNHFWWQGKFYSMSGKDTRFPPYSVCGEGNVQGIHGANCRHHHGAGDGIHNPYEEYDSEENRKQYELEQRQRLLERRIRKTKREVKGLREALDAAQTDESREKLKKSYERKAYLLQKQNKAYNDFCKEHNLKKLSERLKIAQWDRREAAKAAAAAKRRKKELQSG